MHVLVPCVSPHPVQQHVLQTEAATDTRLRVTYARVVGDDGYRQLLRRLWQAREPVVLVEHDVLPWPGAIAELYGCMGRWCAHAYQPYGVYHAFGCAKFTPEVMAATPDVWDTPRHWSQLDSYFYHVARAVGFEPHPHRPPVLHLKGLAAAVLQ